MKRPSTVSRVRASHTTRAMRAFEQTPDMTCPGPQIEAQLYEPYPQRDCAAFFEAAPLEAFLFTSEVRGVADEIVRMRPRLLGGSL